MRQVARIVTAACALFLFAGLAYAAPPVVTSVYPERQRINAGANTPIEVHFNEEIDPASVTAISFRVFGRWSGPATGTTLVNGATISFQPDEPFFAGEWITVSLSKGIENLTGENMVKGYAWNFWIEAANGSTTLSFDYRIRVRTTGESWVQVYGAYAGDINNDGYSDLIAPCEQTDDARVFLSDDGIFSATGMVKEALPNGQTPSPNEGADFDNDGEIDMVIGNTGGNYASVIFGDGTGDFPTGRKISIQCGNSIRGVGVGDFNGDGWDDFVTANRFGDMLSIVMNDGDGTFAPAVTKHTGGNNEYTIGISDANNDGVPDIFCGTFGTPYYMIILLGDGNGGFTAQPPVAEGGSPWQSVLGDFNKDGNVDVASCHSNDSEIGVLYGNGNGGFLGAVTTINCDASPLAIDAGDIDGDGDLDLVTSNYTGGTWNIFSYNTGTGTFGSKKTLNASTSGSCAILHDRDNDGDLDLTGLDETDDWLYFFENTGTASGVPTPTARAVVSLEQNTPNPFNPTTAIRFDLASRSTVNLSVYDASGAFVATLASGEYEKGPHEVRWSGLDARGSRVGSGVYFYRISAAGTTVTRKMVLLK